MQLIEQIIYPVLCATILSTTIIILSKLSQRGIQRPCKLNLSCPHSTESAHTTRTSQTKFCETNDTTTQDTTAACCEGNGVEINNEEILNDTQDRDGTRNSDRLSSVANSTTSWEDEVNVVGEGRVNIKQQDACDIVAAEKLKTAGNTAYRNGLHDDALQYYAEALVKTPSEERSMAATLMFNRAAVYMTKKDYKKVVDCCSDAIDIDKTYTKAYLRRYKAFDEQGEYQEALQDLQTALEQKPELKAQYTYTLANAERKAKIKFERDKQEMIGKLKDAGDWVLGKFGMSVNDFQVAQDPTTGSYSIQYKPKESAA